MVPLSLWSTQALSLSSQFHKVAIQVKSQSVNSDLCLACFVLAAERNPTHCWEHMASLVAQASTTHTCVDPRVHRYITQCARI